MDFMVMKKRLSTFRTPKGQYRGVAADVLLDLLRGWEQWPGSGGEFNSSLGLSKGQLANLIKEAKRAYKRQNAAGEGFQELKVESDHTGIQRQKPCGCIEFTWDGNKTIRFQQVDQLVEFLKKAS
jgi:hypothetical protein